MQERSDANNPSRRSIMPVGSLVHRQRFASPWGGGGLYRPCGGFQGCSSITNPRLDFEPRFVQWRTRQTTAFSALAIWSPGVLLPYGRNGGFLSSQVTGPLRHQPPPQLKQVRALVRRLNPVRIDVRQGQLAHLTGLVGPLSSPLPERCAQAVGHTTDIVLQKQTEFALSRYFPGTASNLNQFLPLGGNLLKKTGKMTPHVYRIYNSENSD